MPEKNLPQVMEIDFDGDVVESTMVDGKIYIPVRRVCENIGLDWSSQRKKLESDPKFNCGDITTVGRDGKLREMTCLDERETHAWLFSINSNRVAKEYREKLLAYQQKCMDVIVAYWRGETINGSKPNPDLSLRRVAETFRTTKSMAGEVGLFGKPAILAANRGTFNVHQIDVLELLEINPADLPSENNANPPQPQDFQEIHPTTPFPYAQEMLRANDSDISDIILFAFQGNSIRAIRDKSGLWFVCHDIARALKYATNMRRGLDAVAEHIKKVRIPINGDQRKWMNVVFIYGLHTMLDRSQKVRAGAMQSWLRDIVRGRIKGRPFKGGSPVLVQ